MKDMHIYFIESMDHPIATDKWLPSVVDVNKPQPIHPVTSTDTEAKQVVGDAQVVTENFNAVVTATLLFPRLCTWTKLDSGMTLTCHCPA